MLMCKKEGNKLLLLLLLLLLYEVMQVYIAVEG